jgi:glycosyltransferase involved in cell wall biosynthesis
MKDNLIKHVSNHSVKNIEFWPVPDGQVPVTQNKADILLLPIKKGAASTSIPSKLPAYMFSAKPIIATVDHDSDTAKAIREAGCGWVIEPENPAALAALMQEITTMPKEKLHSMGMNGREYALKHFSKQANLAKLMAVIEQTAKK